MGCSTFSEPVAAFVEMSGPFLKIRRVVAKGEDPVGVKQKNPSFDGFF
jgi:hypothetical protein